MSRSRRWGLVGVLGLVGFGWWIVRVYNGNEPAQWSVVTRGDFVAKVKFEGRLTAVHSTLFLPPVVPGRWEYKISDMVPDGTVVKTGEPVLTFDNSELERDLLEMNARLESAQKEIEKKRIDITIRRRDNDLSLAEARAKFEKATLKLERPEEFVAGKEIALLELDRELAQQEVTYLESRRALLDGADEIGLNIIGERRDAAAFRVNEIRNGIEKMTLRSSRNGTVIHITNRRGEKKRVGDTVWRRDKVLEVADLTSMKARGLVDESEAGQVTVGQRVEFSLDAYADLNFGGEIRKISKTVQRKTRNSPLRIFRIEIELDKTDEARMRPEMRFKGTIEVERQDDVLLVPVSAVRMSGDGASVYRRSLSGIEERRVKLGTKNKDIVVIVDGLSDGDKVLTRQ